MSLLRILLLLALAFVAWRYALKPLLQVASGGRPKGPRPEPGAKPPHEVLGVSRHASQDEIRAAYQRLVAKYHPDRVDGMGPELIALAEQRTKEINEAYARMKR